MSSAYERVNAVMRLVGPRSSIEDSFFWSMPQPEWAWQRRIHASVRASNTDCDFLYEIINSYLLHWNIINTLVAHCAFTILKRTTKVRPQPKDLVNQTVLRTCNIKQDAVWDGRLRPGAATWKSRPNVVWRPTDDATWRTGRNIWDASSLILAYSLRYMKTWRHPPNPKYTTYCTAVRGRSSHGHR